MKLPEQAVELAMKETDWNRASEAAIIATETVEMGLPICRGQTEEQYRERVERNIKDWNLSAEEASFVISTRPPLLASVQCALITKFTCSCIVRNHPKFTRLTKSW